MAPSQVSDDRFARWRRLALHGLDGRIGNKLYPVKAAIGKALPTPFARPLGRRIHKAIHGPFGHGLIEFLAHVFRTLDQVKQAVEQQRQRRDQALLPSLEAIATGSEWSGTARPYLPFLGQFLDRIGQPVVDVSAVRFIDRHPLLDRGPDRLARRRGQGK